MKNRNLTSAKAIIAAASIAFVASSPVNAAVIYIGDSQGNTAQYDTSTSTLSALGNLSGLTSPGQIIGIAYDEMSDSVLHLYRNGARLYSTHTGTGTSSLVYSGALAQNFQGGAAKGGILYGIDESTQRLRGINLTGFVDAGITGDVLPNHSHALGKDATTGQLYVGAGGNGIRRSAMPVLFPERSWQPRASALRISRFLATISSWPVTGPICTWLTELQERPRFS